VPITVTTQQLDSILGEGHLSMGAATVPQILVTIARFGRVSWKYSALAYAVGVLMQTFYIMAADMNLGACAIGASDIQMFTKNDRYRIPR
jgi:SagB-type dehydrogenase family enzyme